MVNNRIAVTGLACRYPDAESPLALWRNALAQRRAFRRIPAERLRLEDYRSTTSPADSIYSREAALIDGYEFDRVAYRVGGRSYRAADVAHWLALEVAGEALADAGFDHADGLPRDQVGVLVGNTLTGEFSRAQLMRLRWPYVRRQALSALQEEGWEPSRIAAFIDRFEAIYKQPFPETTDESLAGGLANTIAGRIANHFDLHGGGFTVDGACASSLLAVAQACSALAAGDLEVALTGGVDLSLDPFELVGFARTGALAKGDMRIFDRRPTGFIPGEGCGFAVLMRHEDAVARGCRIYAVIRGWGISSDGSGGLTRPEVKGQLLALERAYRRAGYAADTVGLFEGHGTGTAMGDQVELQTLKRARNGIGAGRQAAIGSIKANIGHTKAAAGIAGLIKATQALHHQILPPTTGCEEPHAELSAADSSLRILRRAELWPADAPLRASVSAMGFGGINCHITLEGTAPVRKRGLNAAEQLLASVPQKIEALLFAATDRDGLRQLASRLATIAHQLTRSELADLAAELARQLDPEPRPSTWRAAIVASTPHQLEQRLAVLQSWLDEPWPEEDDHRLEARAGVFLGRVGEAPRIGLLFPGQGSPSHLDGGVWKERFAEVAELYRQADLPSTGDAAETAIAQPAIVTAELAGIRLLDRLGVEAAAAAGHSLGELVALCWAGAWDEAAVGRVAAARGRAMSELGDSTGAMASLGSGPDQVAELIARWPDEDLRIASFNTPTQTVVAGAAAAVDQAVIEAQARGWNATRLAVSHAFHSPRVAAAEPRLAAALAAEELRPPGQPIASTVTGGWLEPDVDLAALLGRQVTAPVRFVEALAALTQRVDVLVEVGPGRVMSGLAARGSKLPTVALDVGAGDFTGLVETVSMLFAMGAPLDPWLLFSDRPIRRFELDHEPRFLANPCESAPWTEPATEVPAAAAGEAWVDAGAPTAEQAAEMVAAGESDPAAEEVAETPEIWIRQLLARRAELPIETLSDDLRLLGDLHLSSIVVSEVVTEAARHLGVAPPLAPAEYANATVAELTTALGELAAAGVEPIDTSAVPAGVAGWVRSFSLEQVEVRPPAAGSAEDDVVSRWFFYGAEETPWRRALEGLLSSDEPAKRDDGEPQTTGAVLCLTGEDDPLEELLAAAQRALAEGCGYFLLVGPRAHQSSAAAFVRALHLEAPELAVTVVSLPADELEDTVGWSHRILAAVLGTRTFRELRFAADGKCYEPRLAVLPATDEIAVPALAADDLVVVSGGGKGIGAECALALGQRFGVALGVLGRSAAEDDEELAANLERFATHGVRCSYQQVDVSDGPGVARAIAELQAELGPVRAILHSAGANQPRLIADMDRAILEQTLAAKVEGLAHLLAAVEPRELRLVVGFGSIIGRMGLQGEAHYALANHRLRRSLERVAEQQPQCRTLCLEWSVWSGVGMGARLAQLDVLAHQGITPIPPQTGVAELLALLDRPSPVSVVVSGRFGRLPTLRSDGPELPLQRFLELPRFHVPGVELVVDTEISMASDPYLADHLYSGERLFPAVLGLESMAQVALALTGRTSVAGLSFTAVRFERPVTVPETESVTLRLVALQYQDGSVEVALRSSRSEFKVDHFRARLVFGDGPGASFAEVAEGELLALDLADLYGPVLFQSGRFQRVLGYHSLSATACEALVETDPAASWFAPLLPAELLLGDPGARDASLHSVQASIPHATVLPVSVGRIELGPAVTAEGRRRVKATERERHDRTLIYDLEVLTEEGELIERWQRLELRAMDEPGRQPRLVPVLVAPYLERRLADLLPGAELRVALAEQQPGESRQRGGQRAIEEALGHRVTIVHRPDGKPEAVLGAVQNGAGTNGDARHGLALNGSASNGTSSRGAAKDDHGSGDTVAKTNGHHRLVQPATSVSYEADWALAMVGRGALGCDIERVAGRRQQTWQDLLGDRWPLVEVLNRELGEDRDSLATRLWTVQEALKKAGSPLPTPLVFVRSSADGWMHFSAGDQQAVVQVLQLGRDGIRVAVAAVVESAPTAESIDQESPTATVALPRPTELVVEAEEATWEH